MKCAWDGEELLRNKLIFEMKPKKEGGFRSEQVDGSFTIGQSTEEKVFSRVTSDIFAKSKLETEY